MKDISFPRGVLSSQMFGGSFSRAMPMVLMPNRAMHKETEVYGEDVDNLRPERHLTPEGNLKPASVDSEGHFTYGFGRR